MTAREVIAERHGIAAVRADAFVNLLTNLVLVCNFHHHLLHEYGWNVESNPAGGHSWITTTLIHNEAITRTRRTR